ncbi:YcaO-like family protein [Variovorax sp. Varisp41]|uniref:YcaO-like family protein n=1 Tax=Variovorax sp. Varisp41 TaxID=3243033 RepID=UPI0039B44E00
MTSQTSQYPRPFATPRWPVAAGRWTYGRDGMLCELPLKRLRVHAPAEFLRAVERQCDGRTEWQAVHRDLSERWPVTEVDACLRTMLDQGVIVEAGQALAQHARLGWAPQPLAAPLQDPAALHALKESTERRLRREASAGELLRPADTALARALRARESVRTFDDRALPLQSIVNVLWSLYGVLEADGERVRRTVPSGGALYGLRWFLALFRPTGRYAAALYEVDYHATGEFGGAISLRAVPGAIDDAWNTLLTPGVLRFAHAAVYPVADLEFVGQKYGNRSLTLALIEAGHALQNAALTALEESMSTIVRGDTVEMEVQSLFGLGHSLYPLPAIVLGATPTRDQQRLARQAQERVPLHPFPMHTLKLPLPVRVAVAGPIPLGRASGHVLWATGRSENPRIAAIKAEAEGWERIGWSTVSQEPRRDRFDAIEHAVDPRELVAYSDAQYRRADFPFRAFSTRRTHAWSPATDARDGKIAWILSQCVYASSALSRRDTVALYTNASTSGVAAFTDMATARVRALVELVERDAFVRAWLSRSPPPRIHEAGIDASLRERLKCLRTAGYAVSLHQLPSVHLPVVAVFAQNAGSAMTSLTTAAGFNFDEAVDSALGEAESRIQQRYGRPVHPSMQPVDVKQASQHGDFFNTRAQFRNADWLLESPTSISIQDVSAQRLPSDGPRLLDHLIGLKLDVLFCDLTPPSAALDQGRTPLHVARAFVKGLLPIWFGAGVEPLGLRALSGIALHAAVRAGRDVHPCT